MDVRDVEVRMQSQRSATSCGKPTGLVLANDIQDPNMARVGFHEK